MKRFIKTALTVVLAAAAVSCVKEMEPQKENNNGTIELAITGTINGYTPQEETKAEAQTVVRIMWKGGETVYVFDGTECLGSLTASIEGTDGTYAKLTGDITTTEATTLTFVYSPQFDAEPDVTEGGKISLDLSEQDDAEVPFLIYATLPTAQASATFSNEVVQFNLATSVFKCNCAGLGGDGEISKAVISGVNTKCELTLSASGTPTVNGTTPGTITRTDGFTQAAPADQRAIFSVALPKTDESAQDRTIEVTKGIRTFTSSYPNRAFDVSKSFNSVFALEYDYDSTPFTITSKGSTKVRIEGQVETHTINLEYRTGSSDWTTYDFTTVDWEAVGEEVSLNDGEFVQFRAGQDGNATFSKEEQPYMVVVEGSGKVSVSGNIMSLLDNTLQRTSLDEFIFNCLFIYCDKLTDASELVLPATTLANGCYYGMFKGCARLADAPELPATTLAEGCYSDMFEDSGLIDAPELPATTLAKGCYSSMFGSCYKLTEAPELPAQTLAEGCYSNMFYFTGLIDAPELPAQTLATNCYRQMFYCCEYLEIAPSLSATTLANNCYEGMFNGCTSLTEVPSISATTLANECCSYMFNGCTSLTEAPDLLAETLAEKCYFCMFMNSGLEEAPELKAMTLAPYCCTHMFSGCTDLTEAPVLKATDLVTGCYYNMFYNCTSLGKVKALFTTTPGTTYTGDWLYGVESNGTFVKNDDATWDSGLVRGPSSVPDGWEIKKESDE